MQKQEYTFSLHAQSYEIFYSHSTSQLAGVLLAVKRNAGISVIKFSPVSPYLRVLDILVIEQPYHMLACYAPMQPKERKTFFQLLTAQMIQDSTIVMGDLNSVRSPQDRTSRQVDPTTDLLNDMCEQFSLTEVYGSNFYTYQHPSLQCRSRIDYIMGPLAFLGNLALTGWWTSLSDNQVLVAAPCLDDGKGPGLWKFPDDVLDDESFVKEIETLLHGPDPNLDMQVIWETLNWISKLKLSNLQSLIGDSIKVNYPVYRDYYVL